MVIETDRAWAAGFFDGEGSVGFIKGHYKRKVYRRFVVQIGQTARWPLERFREAVGGYGKIHGPYNYGHKDYWSYRAEGKDAVTAFSEIAAFLGPVKLRRGLRAMKIYEDNND